MVRNVILIIVFVFTVASLQAQTEIKRSAISPVGYTTTAGSVKLLCTAGELAVNENTQGTVHLSEGFINPELAVITGVAEYVNSGIDVTVFPNPATKYLNLKFSNPNDYEIVLCSIKGETINTYMIHNDTHKQIPLNKLANGEYLLIVKNKTEKTYKTFKLIKQ